MTLSAQNVRDARFGTTRIRAGYNMVEVDAFLDQVEDTIAHRQAKASDSVMKSRLRSQVRQCKGAWRRPSANSRKPSQRRLLLPMKATPLSFLLPTMVHQQPQIRTLMVRRRQKTSLLVMFHR